MSYQPVVLVVLWGKAACNNLISHLSLSPRSRTHSDFGQGGFVLGLNIQHTWSQVLGDPARACALIQFIVVYSLSSQKLGKEN